MKYKHETIGHELFGKLIIGAIIGIAVVLVRDVIVNAPQTQILTLALTAVVLCIAQIRFARRRINRSSSYDRYSSEHSESKPQGRSKHSDPFARELNQSWTGLMPSDSQTISHLDLGHTAFISDELSRDAQQSLNVRVVTVSRRSSSHTTQSSANDSPTIGPHASASVTNHSSPSASPDPRSDGS